jgi:hypothetical protein
LRISPYLLFDGSTAHSICQCGLEGGQLAKRSGFLDEGAGRLWVGGGAKCGGSTEKEDIGHARRLARTANDEILVAKWAKYACVSIDFSVKYTLL